MPRFTDEWVLDRVLFDYVSGGSCACCGFQHFLPNGTADLIGAVTDLESDQVRDEVAALEHHPWPTYLRDQVWADRVKLRQKLKRTLRDYADFWAKHAPNFEDWCRSNSSTVVRLLQLPRTEILEDVRQKYNVHSAYGVVMCAMVEQVAFFELTAYPTDARGDRSEEEFEKALKFGRMSGFILKVTDGEGNLDEKVLQIWLRRMKALGGPKLLGRRSGESKATDDEGDDADKAVTSTQTGPSFQSDRRIIRLLIARYWSDALMKRYLDEMHKGQKVED